MNRSDFYLEAEKFLNKLFFQLGNAGIDLPAHWSIDHLCYRVQSQEAYQEFKVSFTQFAELLIESEVNGRMISTFKLPEPVRFRDYFIDLVELPAPKPGKTTIQGFEHVEVVAGESFAILQKEHAAQKLDEGGLKKLFNPELEIELTDCALKFHPLSLESVVVLEKNKRVYQALMQSEVLETLKAYSPLVAGTYPLDLDVEGSDLDILLTAQDLDELSQLVHAKFSQYRDFKSQRTFVDDVPTLIINFNFQNVPFELFAQAQSSITQKAYRHFQVEERLLKLGGPVFKEKVLILRVVEGYKTEPAFATALGIEGDPYVALLGLHAKSEAELAKLF